MAPFNPEIAILVILSSKNIGYTTRVFDKIREVKPTRLYIAHNTTKEAEEEDELEVFLEGLEFIDWECDVSTLFKEYSSSDHLINEAISWFFKAEPRGIVLENVYVPQTDFFGFCSELLDEYENDDRISHISGTNYHQKLTKEKNESYYFSSLTSIEGWAGWRRTVEGMCVKGYAKFKKADLLNKIPSYTFFKGAWYDIFDKSINNKSGSWQAKLTYSNIVKGRLSIVPRVSLIANAWAKFDPSAPEMLEIGEMKHPDFVVYDYEIDIKKQERYFSMPVLTKNVPDGYDFVNKKLLRYAEKIKGDLRIPKIIHQIYEDPAGPPEHLLQLAESWKEKNPDWEYRFWGKKDMDDFLEAHFPEFISIYRNYPYNVQRWDAIRYLILYTLGGLYVDLDYECFESMDVLLSGSTCCMGMEPTINSVVHNKKLIVGNAMMASVPGHKYFEMIIDDMIENRNTIFSEYGPTQIMQTTGPFFTTRVYEKLRRKSIVTLLPAGLVAPLTMNEVRQMLAGKGTPFMSEKLERAYAVHYFLGSWCTSDVF